MTIGSNLLLLPSTLCLFLFVSPSAANPWIQVRIVNVEAGIVTPRQKDPAFKVTINVQMGGCKRGVLKLKTSTVVDGRDRNWTKTKTVRGSQRGQTNENIEILVAEKLLKNPSAGDPINFFAEGKGYYSVTEYREEEYIEYVPVPHSGGHPGGGDHPRGGNQPGGFRF